MEFTLFRQLNSMVFSDLVDNRPLVTPPGHIVGSQKQDKQCTHCNTAALGPVLNSLGSARSQIARTQTIGPLVKAYASGVWKKDTIKLNVLKRLLASQRPSMPSSLITMTNTPSMVRTIMTNKQIPVTSTT